MPYVMIREELSLKLRKGDTLKHKKDELPIALKFAAEWVDPELAEKPKAKTAAEKKAEKEAEDLAAAEAKAAAEAEEAAKQAALDSQE